MLFRSRAKAAFDAAQAAYVGERYDEAIASFKKAYEARNSPLFLFNIGAAFQMKGKKSADPADLDQAVEYYRRYLTEEPEAGDKAEVDKTIASLEEQARLIRTPPPPPPPGGDGTGSGDGSGSGSGTVTPPPPPVTPVIADAKLRGLVVIESEPQGANIYINGKDKGALSQTPWSGSLEGEFTYLIEKRGYKSKEGRLPADPSHLTVLQVVLSEEDYLGWLEIKSNVPGAKDRKSTRLNSSHG